MHYTSAAAALVALSSVASAFPAQTSSWKQHFTVQQSATGRKIPISGATAYKKALAKYGATIPEPVITAVNAVQNGSVEANPTQYDSQYLAPVSVGGQTLMLDFDTGSADLWCFSTELLSNEQNGQALYNPTKSSTASKKSGYSWKISYGDQSGASGDVYADKVVIGGVTATSQAVEAATSVSSQFSQDSQNDGLVGFAFSSINTVTPQSQNTWFDTVKSSLPQQLFTVTLKYQQPGTYDFGFIDSSKYDGSLTYTAVDNSQGFWAFTADGYSVGGVQTSDSLKAIADTGTSLILVSADVVSAYYAKVTGSSSSNTAGGYVFPCTSTLPDFGITIGGQSFTVPGKYINYAPNGDGTCYGGIQSSAGIGFNILGDVFLKAQYVVFDAGNMQLGFAPQAGTTAAPTPPPASNATFVPRSATYPRASSPRLDFTMLNRRVPKTA